jgi:hypothetical protein
LSGILLLAMIGFYILRFGGGSGRSSSRGKGGGAQIVLVGVAMLVIGYIGLFFARLIKAAVSRQREYLADASSVQFTRNPDGIASALKKIGGLAAGSRMETPEAETASHMFFGSAFRRGWLGAFATHPPLDDRIRRIDSRFDGTFPTVRPISEKQPPRVAKPPVARPGSAEAIGRTFGKLRVGDRLPLDPLLIMAAVGSPDTGHVSYAQKLIEAMPQELKTAVQDTFSARAVVFALLLDEDAEIRTRQLGSVQQRLGDATRDETRKLAPLVADQGAGARLPLIEMVQSTLRELSSEQYRQFRSVVVDLVRADRKINLFEFALQRVLLARLDRHFFGGAPPRVRHPAIGGLLSELTTLLSALAYVGHSDDPRARLAFDQAVASLRPGRSLDMPPRRDCSLTEISTALDKLVLAAPAIKRRVLHAALIVVGVDRQVTVGEAEMLRTIADSLDCPLPPILPGPLPGTGRAPEQTTPHPRPPMAGDDDQ